MNDDIQKSSIVVSVVMPIYNEEKHITKCMLSLLEQDYQKKKMEWIFVDGGSTDKTIEIIGNFMEKFPDLIKILNNPNRTVPYAMNIGIKASVGQYIVRLDAHSEYANNYISKCVFYLDTLKVDNVGGVAETKSNGFIGNAIASMLSSKFGVGNSAFRTFGESGYVDTVPFGAFRRDVFDNYGYYDERLTRNQDNEMNYRIRKNKGKIYMSEDIKLSYYCRDTISGIVDMAIKNGKWNIITMKLCPGAMGIRHFIPLLFLLSLIFMPILYNIALSFKYVFILEIILYLILDIIFSFKANNNKKYSILLLVLFPLFHISYGVGSVIGIFKKVNK